MFELKRYQKNVLSALSSFLERCRDVPVGLAYQEIIAEQDRNDPYNDLFSGIPCVCLRVPTGGGKTILAAHSISLVGKTVQNSDAPIALWLTPSDTIRTQTLEALSNGQHPYRKALAQYFGDSIQICDLASLQTISPHDIGKACIIIVTTIQSLNVTDTSTRNVYSFFEELGEHFKDLPSALSDKLEKVTEADIEQQPFLTNKDLGRVKWSVANWLNLHCPMVVVDEAHNNRTDRFFKTLGRLNPSCIVELTATPVPGNNVLYSVSAQELRAEQMIKLPIVLAEHPEGWRECLRDAVLTRDGLEIAALKEEEYVRPIVLVQAMPKGGEATVEVVRQHLIDEENISAEQIAVATGTQKELDGVDLFDRACQVRYIITIEALKEGWDCSFAYVLSSLQSVNSAKDVEQLLGRVLRMPYAKDRQQDALNKAYAHIVATNFAEAASNLKDRLVQNMGFERLETGSLIVPQIPLPLVGGEVGNTHSIRGMVAVIPDCHVELPALPVTEHWPDEIKAKIDVRPTSQGATVVIKGEISPEDLKQAEAFITASLPARVRQKVEQQFADHRALRRAMRAPAQLGLQFAPIPQLCLMLEGYLEVVERDTLAGLGEWNLLDLPVQLAGFTIQETVNSFEIDVADEKVKFKYVDALQLRLNEVASHITEQDLVRWLDQEVRKPYISQLQLQAYLTKLMAHLLHDRKFTLTALVRARFQLAQASALEITRLRKLAIEKGFQRQLFEMKVPTQAEMKHHSFTFDAGKYPARNLYNGSYEFQKHFYDVIHDLREKTLAGNSSEEFRCAMAIDSNTKVTHWVRNIERQEHTSFWLPTATDYFYPDFVAELDDGRILVVEYKGEVYSTNDDSREKKQVGHQWEQASNGRCLFLFALERDESGRDVFKQIADKVK